MQGFSGHVRATQSAPFFETTCLAEACPASRPCILLHPSVQECRHFLAEQSWNSFEVGKASLNAVDSAVSIGIDV